jgi:hypothetical protein
MGNTDYIDPKEYYGQSLDSWRDVWNDDLSLYENTSNILSMLLVIPNKKVLLPIAATYLLIPSKWAFKVGILFSWGDEGSGKSTIAKFAARMHGHSTLFSPADTFASVRNALDKMRWIDIKEKEMEKEGAILCWDNIHCETLERDLKLYQLLLFGYDRNTDRIQIAGANGENREYFVFCPKCISSVHPIHTVTTFNELTRRLILIPHKKWEKFTPEEKKEYDNFDFLTDMLDFDCIHWDGVSDNYFNFWNNHKNCADYVQWRKLLTRQGKKTFVLPDSISPANWAISIDIVATGLVLGTWTTINDAISCIGEYWKLINDNYLNDFSATMSHLRDFIYQEAGTQLEINEKRINLGEKSINIVIDATRLKNHLSVLQNEGKLDISPRNKDINDIMWRLGWKLGTIGWIQR